MMSSCPTIFALSSGRVPSGIAIVRVSGPQASQALSAIAGRLPAPRFATRSMLHDGEGLPLDNALVLWFPAPHSATGEDVAEFHIHGGRAVVAALIAALGAMNGLRLAEAGEFSRRAFEHGKLDLVAAEALDDLIHADTEQQRRQALRQLNGMLGDRARHWRRRVIDATAMVAASIDFSDEGDVPDTLIGPAQAAAHELACEIEAVLTGSAGSERLREGLVVAIAGPPNVGKSTLLNRFANRDVAIVSPYAGTTRDVLEVQLDLSGYPVTMIDTAGLRESLDPVEQEGIRRARDRAAVADLVLWLSDSDDADQPQPTGGVLWRIRTKADVAVSHAPPFPDFIISAKTGMGMDRLGTAIAAFAGKQFSTEQGLITRARHRTLLADSLQALKRAAGQDQPELIAEDLRAGADGLGRLLGRIDVEDVLDSIFARFCIGK